MKRRIDIVIIALVIGLLAGCGGRAQQHPWGTLTECEDQNTELSLQIQTLQTKNDQLTEQVATLSGLDKNTRLPALDTLEKIRIGKYTGFYDADQNGTKESLVVYLEPLDTAQDYIKAVGTVNIELWDLSAPEDKAKGAEWTVEPTDLHKNWGGTIFRSYYRLEFVVTDLLPAPRNRVGTHLRSASYDGQAAYPAEYTLKVTFIDYLAGKVLTDQKVITVQ